MHVGQPTGHGLYSMREIHIPHSPSGRVAEKIAMADMTEDAMEKLFAVFTADEMEKLRHALMVGEMIEKEMKKLLDDWMAGEIEKPLQALTHAPTAGEMEKFFRALATGDMEKLLDAVVELETERLLDVLTASGIDGTMLMYVQFTLDAYRELLNEVYFGLKAAWGAAWLAWVLYAWRRGSRTDWYQAFRLAWTTFSAIWILGGAISPGAVHLAS